MGPAAFPKATVSSFAQCQHALARFSAVVWVCPQAGLEDGRVSINIRWLEFPISINHPATLWRAPRGNWHKLQLGTGQEQNPGILAERVIGR